MYQFDYKRPTNLDDAKALLADEDAKLLAGGQTLLPTMKQRLAMPSALVDIGRLAELKGISEADGVVSVGAGERHADVAASPVVTQHIPGLASLAGQIGDPHVRHMGTLGGSIANNDPSADYPAACLGLAATIHTAERAIAADDFFIDVFETALDEGEIITRVDFPVPVKSAYAKFLNPASRYAVVGVFVAQTKDGVRVAVTGAGPGVFRVPDMEHALAASFTPDALAGISVPVDDLNSDLHATAEYRAHLITVMAKRAVQSLI